MVNKNVLKAYQRNRYEYVERSEDQVEKKFWKEISDPDGKLFFNLTHSVTKVVRVKAGASEGGKEFFYYEDRMRGYNHVGNAKDFTATVGKYSLPIFVRNYDDKTRAVIGTQISQHETKYEIEWSTRNWNKVKANLSYDEATFYVEVPGRRYRIFTLEEFEDATYDQLVRMGRNGKTLNELRLDDSGRGKIQKQSMWSPPSERLTTVKTAAKNAQETPNQQDVLLPRQHGTIKAPKNANIVSPTKSRNKSSLIKRRNRTVPETVKTEDMPEVV